MLNEPWCACVRIFMFILTDKIKIEIHNVTYYIKNSYKQQGTIYPNWNQASAFECRQLWWEWHHCTVRSWTIWMILPLGYLVTVSLFDWQHTHWRVIPQKLQLSVYVCAQPSGTFKFFLFLFVCSELWLSFSFSSTYLRRALHLVLRWTVDCFVILRNFVLIDGCLLLLLHAVGDVCLCFFVVLWWYLLNCRTSFVVLL